MITGRQSLKLATAIALIQLSALFLRSFARRRFEEAGVDIADPASVWLAFIWLSLLMAPLAWRYPIIIRGLARLPARPMRMAAVGLAVGIVFRAIDWLMHLARTNVILLPSGLAVAPHAVGDYSPIVWWNVITLALLTPVLEELVNRGMVFRLLKPMGQVQAVGLSALIFSVAHPFGVIPLAFLFGVVAALLYQRSGSLLAPVVAHMAFNMLAVVERFWVTLHPYPDIPVTILYVAALVLVAAVLAMAFVTTAGAASDPGASGR